MRSHARSPLWSTLFFALLGLIWCGYIAFPTANPAPCASSGCALFRDSRLAGISLWWIGGAYFFLLAVLCLRGNRAAARLMAMLALLADAALLVVMFLTAPCFDCLVVAALMGCCYYSLRQQPETSGMFKVEASHSLLLPVWFGLFLGNAVLAVNERLPLYALGNTRSSEVRIYFSPSCSACREALLALGNTASLLPVEEQEGDFEAILRLRELLKTGTPLREALARSLNEAEPVPSVPVAERALLAVQLVRNKAALLRQGFRAVPLIQINGMPGYTPHRIDRPNPPPRNGAARALPGDPVYHVPPPDGDFEPRLPTAPAPDAPAGIPLPDFLQGADSLRQCGGATAEPCDEEPALNPR